MNEATLKKLMRNPHYKMSGKEKEEIVKVERKPMEKFGEDIHIHNTNIPVHKVKIKRKQDARI